MNDPSSPTIDVSHLSVAERILLVEQIWDGIRQETDALPPSPAQLEELDRRLARYGESVEPSRDWEEVKRRIKDKR